MAEESAVDKTIEAMETAMKERKDEAVGEGIDTLIDLYIQQGASESDKGKIVNALGKALRHVGEGDQITMKAAQGLAGMGEDAAKELAAAMKDRRFRKDEELEDAYLAMIRALGATKSLRESKILMDLLKDKNFEVIAAAADALGNYNDVKLAYRKRIAEAMIKALDSAYNSAKADPRNTTLQKKYEIVGTPLFVSLQKVTGASVNSPEDWRKWYNDNKKKRWD
jgi:ATP:corrinoid adenosyltransferase